MASANCSAQQLHDYENSPMATVKRQGMETQQNTNSFDNRKRPPETPEEKHPVDQRIISTTSTPNIWKHDQNNSTNEVTDTSTTPRKPIDNRKKAAVTDDLKVIVVDDSASVSLEGNIKQDGNETEQALRKKVRTLESKLALLRQKEDKRRKLKNSTKPCGKIGKTLRRWKRKYLEDSDDEVDDQDCDIFDIDTHNDNHTTNSSDYTGRNGPDIKFSQVDDDDGVPVIDDAEFLESTIDDCSNEDDDNEVTIAVSNASNGNDNDVKEGMKSNAEAVNSIVNGRDTNKNAAVSRKPKHATTQKVGVEKAKQNTSPPKAKFKKAESMAESQKVAKPRRGRQPGVQKSSNTKTQSKKKFKTQLTPSRTLPYRSRTKPDRLIAGDNKKKGTNRNEGVCRGKAPNHYITRSHTMDGSV